MKKIVLILIIFIALLNINSYAQNSATISIHKTDKTVITYNLSDIDSITFTPCVIGGCGNVNDNDGNVYNTVTIGLQCWMQKNLNVTHYNNGDAIPNVTDNTTWDNMTTGAYCNYNNDANNASIYGHLYNWYAATDSRNLCPSGWHVPDTTECKILINYLGGINAAGGVMKSTSSLWTNPNVGATNGSGFSALPGGNRTDYNSGSYADLGGTCDLWSATMYNSGYALNYYLLSNYQGVHIKGIDNKIDGFSIRCLKN